LKVARKVRDALFHRRTFLFLQVLSSSASGERNVKSGAPVMRSNNSDLAAKLLLCLIARSRFHTCLCCLYGRDMKGTASVKKSSLKQNFI
jgi:hypothetical protein